MKTLRSASFDADLALLIMQLLETVFLVEFINTTAGIYEFLLAGIKRVALGADLNGDVLLGGACLNDGTASTFNSGLLVVGMYSFLHFFSPVSSKAALIVPAGHSYKTQKRIYHRGSYYASIFYSFMPSLTSFPGARKNNTPSFTFFPQIRDKASAYASICPR